MGDHSRLLPTSLVLLLIFSILVPLSQPLTSSELESESSLNLVSTRSGGLIDVASNVGIDFQEEDLGQTLATAGWNRSAYFYVPVAGPSNARDLPGMAFRSVLPRLILGNSYTWWINYR